VRRALVTSAGALVNVDASGGVLLVRNSVGLSSSVESSFASALELVLAVSWDTGSKWVAVVSASSANSERIVSSRALVFSDLVDASLSLDALVSSSFAFIDVDASLWSVGAVSELSTVLSVSVSVVTVDAVAVVTSLGVAWSADGHCVALVSTESAWAFVSKTGVRSGSIGAVLQ
jgi:hypothetical protein